MSPTFSHMTPPFSNDSLDQTSLKLCCPPFSFFYCLVMVALPSTFIPPLFFLDFGSNQLVGLSPSLEKEANGFLNS